MKKYIFIIVVLLIATTCWATSITFNGVTVSGITVGGTASYLIPIGDSITAGAGSTELTGYKKYLYPMILRDRTYKFVGTQNASSVAPNTYGQCEAISGYPTSKILTLLSGDLATIIPNPGQKSVALIHAGTNDLAGTSFTPYGCEESGNNICDTDELNVAVAGVISLVDAVKTHNPDIAVYVALIIPARANATFDADAATFNSLLNTALIAKQQTTSKLYIVDMNTAFSGHSEYWTTQMYHPNDAGYAAMAQAWATAILANEN